MFPKLLPFVSLFLFCAYLASCSSSKHLSSHQHSNVNNVPAKNNEPIMTWADHMPRFHGATTDRESTEYILNYLQYHIKYPPMAQLNHTEGKVYVTFVVEEDGRISHVKAMNYLGDGLTEEAIEVIQHMPKWTPGQLNGRPVRVQFTIPINFVVPKSGIR